MPLGHVSVELILVDEDVRANRTSNLPYIYLEYESILSSLIIDFSIESRIITRMVRFVDPDAARLNAAVFAARKRALVRLQVEMYVHVSKQGRLRFGSVLAKRAFVPFE